MADNDNVVDKKRWERTVTKTGMVMTTLYLPEKILNEYDKLIEHKVIGNRSETFRVAITDYLLKLKKITISDEDIDKLNDVNKRDQT